jgi:hypothetical protein
MKTTVTTRSALRDTRVGTLRVVLAATPTGYAVTTHDSATNARTVAEFAGWTTAAARFDSTVTPTAPRAVIGDDTILCVYCEGDAVSDDGCSDCPRCAGRGYAVRS